MFLICCFKTSWPIPIVNAEETRSNSKDQCGRWVSSVCEGEFGRFIQLVAFENLVISLRFCFVLFNKEQQIKWVRATALLRGNS